MTDEIEELADADARARSRITAPETPAPFDFASMFPTNFAKCTKDGCENRSAGAARLCPDCADGTIATSCEAERATLETVPRAHRWADPRSPDWKLPGPEFRLYTDADVEELSRIRRLLFVGGSGSGKTTLASACLRRWSSRGQRGVFMSAAAIPAARREHPSGRGEPPTITLAKSAALLLLDDLGIDAADPLNDVVTVIQERREHNRPTWVTTGLTSAQIAIRYPSMALRRLWDGGKLVDLRAPRPAAAPPQIGEAKP